MQREYEMWFILPQLNDKQFLDIVLKGEELDLAQDTDRFKQIPSDFKAKHNSDEIYFSEQVCDGSLAWSFGSEDVW